jgi:A/G-specific adenine glycosylase
MRDVLNAWEGLGYYSRARNLHKSAVEIVTEYSGQIPDDISELRKLPGVGRYTAGAIASLAFGQNEPAVDGNVRRVFSRYFNIEQPIGNADTEKLIWKLAYEHLPAGNAGAYNQALMDLGAVICTPREPKCDICPLNESCQAQKLGVQAERPVRESKSKTPHFTVTAAVIRRGELVLITQRPLDGLLGGLWEFPGGKLQAGEDLVDCLKREINEELGVDIEVGGGLGVYRHAYTHFRVTLHAFACELTDHKEPEPRGVADMRWIPVSDLSSFPMGKIDRQIANLISNDGFK